jgi:hypothetical protein
MAKWVGIVGSTAIGLLAFAWAGASGVDAAHTVRTGLPRHGYETVGDGRSESGLRWSLAVRPGSAPCMRLSLAARPTERPRPRAWDCFGDFMTDVVIYPDCVNDDAYVYGPVPRRVVRVVVIYNHGRRRRGDVFRRSPGGFYLAALSRLRALRDVRAYARGGHLVDDLRIGFSDVCRARGPRAA